MLRQSSGCCERFIGLEYQRVRMKRYKFNCESLIIGNLGMIMTLEFAEGEKTRQTILRVVAE
jgi:hypothetical protein